MNDIRTIVILGAGLVASREHVDAGRLIDPEVPLDDLEALRSRPTIAT